MKEKCMMCTYFRKNTILTEMDRVNRIEGKDARILGNCIRKETSFMVYGNNHCKYFRNVLLYPIMKPKSEAKKERKTIFQKVFLFFKRIFKK